MTIGYGYNGVSPLINNIAKSLTIGLGTELIKLLFFVGGGAYGKARIGTTSPSESFEVGEVNGSDVDTKLIGPV